MSNCDKYAEWITDAGLGALASNGEGELLAHAAECDDCLEAYQHARELAALVDRGVESFVEGAPSPHFATRVRARIAEEYSQQRLDWLGWKPVAAGAATVALLAVLTISFGHTPHRAEPATRGLRADANSTERFAVTPPSITQAKSLRSGDQIEARRQKEATRLVARDHAATRSRPAAEPEVLVPPGQLDAILQFARAVSAGRIDGKQLLAAQEEAEKPLAIEALEIAPLNPPQTDVTPDAQPSGRR